VSLTDGAGQTVFTDSNGDYEFIDLPSGTYSITPAYKQYVFSPVSRQVSVPPKASKEDFIQVEPSIFLPIVIRKACQSLYIDDFSDPNSGWPNFEDENKRYEYVGGEYEILEKNANSWAGASPDFQASDYLVGVDVRSTSGVIGSHGIIFGLTGDWSGFYTFEIDPEGYYTIWKYQNNGWKNLFVKYSPVINTTTELNRLMVKRVGTSIEVYANGNLLTSITDKTYTGMGYVGLIVSSFDEINVEARFDNFYVNPITCDSSTQLSIARTGKDLDARPAQFMYMENRTKFR
ncbi:MAG: carboxypeptidase-like regulatory domain-containing protein, partial [Anaerolineales bacterium]